MPGDQVRDRLAEGAAAETDVDVGQFERVEDQLDLPPVRSLLPAPARDGLVGAGGGGQHRRCPGPPALGPKKGMPAGAVGIGGGRVTAPTTSPTATSGPGPADRGGPGPGPMPELTRSSNWATAATETPPPAAWPSPQWPRSGSKRSSIGSGLLDRATAVRALDTYVLPR